MTSLLLLLVFASYSTTGVYGQNGAFGTTFIFSFPYNIGGGIPSVFISTQLNDPVTVTVSVPGIRFTHLVHVTRDQGATIDLPEEAAITTRISIKTNKAVVIHAGEPVTIHGYYTGVGFADGFLVLPATALGKNYVAVGYAPTYEYNSEFAVTAIEDQTTVLIKGQTKFSISLKQYESYQFVADSNSMDVTGMLINANKPVSVMSGHPSSSVSSDDPIPSIDYLMENIPPVSALGHHYILAPFLGRTSGFVYRVVATSSDVTNVTISGVNVSLSTGEFYEGNAMTSEDLITVLADKPIIVCQYAKGYHTDNVGDPFMVLLPPIQAFYHNVTFPVATLANRNQQYYISITSECGNIYSFYLDGLPLNVHNSSLLQTFDGAFCVIRTNITTGFHTVTHPSASFLVIVYGFAEFQGYGYVAGYNVGLNNESDVDSSITTENSSSRTSTISVVNVVAVAVSVFLTLL
ncbi:IgGFc-binding protein-like [Amphiura filiformis]|uniref:IgGFc-binding protein-like n=1 Tax=Amphiura filiformis TaxID=82378 RepID=UPI003B21B559